MDRLGLLSDAKTLIAQSGQHEGVQTCGVRNMGILQTKRATLNACSMGGHIATAERLWALSEGMLKTA